MKFKASVNVNLDGLKEDVKARVSVAVERAAQKAVQVWDRAIFDAKLSPYDKDAYRASLKYNMLGDFAAEVFTDFRYAEDIERGRPARDQKVMLQTSKKTRVVKRGKNAGSKYLIIPFRHNIPNNESHAKAMPDLVYAQAKMLTKSRILSVGTRISATGHSVAQNKYEWGERLPEGLMPKLKPHHTTDIYAGMVRFDTSSGKQKSSSYLTFRIMGGWQSNKWIIPQQPALPLAKFTYDTIAPLFVSTINRIVGG